MRSAFKGLSHLLFPRLYKNYQSKDMIFLAWRSAGITLKTPPIERYDFSASKLYPIFFFNFKKNIIFFDEKKMTKIFLKKKMKMSRHFWKFDHFKWKLYWKKISTNFIFFLNIFLEFFPSKKNIFFWRWFFFWIQFRTRKSISFDWWGFQSDSGTEESRYKQPLSYFFLVQKKIWMEQ